MVDRTKFEALINYFRYNSNNYYNPPNNEIPAYPTLTLIASAKGRPIFGLNRFISTNSYCDRFYANILPFKVKEIMVMSAGWEECICYWTTDDRLLFSGIYFLEENKSNYVYKYNLTNEHKCINENMTELFEFKWKDFIKNKLSRKINSNNIKQVYVLGDCLIIELNNILFYYYLKKFNRGNILFSFRKDFYGIIPVNNVKWIKGGIMGKKVFIYTFLNELFTFKEETLGKVNLNFLQQSNNKTLIRLATTNQSTDALVTEENKIYFKAEHSSNRIVIPNKSNFFEYHETPFEKESKIIDIKGGFCHFIVLLDNRKVYSIGFNNLGQIGENQTIVEKTYEFKQIVLKSRENILVDKIYTSSCGTVLRTTNEFIFLGEVIEGFIMKNMIPNIQNSYILKREETMGCKWNSVSCGPWSYLVYYKEESITKDKAHFLKNLEKYSLNCEMNLTHDIRITW